MREEGKKQSKAKGNSSSFTMCRNALYFFLQNKRKKRSKKKKTTGRSSNKLVIY